jgi:integrase
MTTTVKSWGDALDYTWRVKWKRKNSAKTNAINSNHITNYAGRSLPLKRMSTAGWWMELIADLEDEGRSGSTINRIISAGTTVMRFTQLAGLHDINCPKFERCKEGEHRLTYFTKEQVEQLALISRDLYGHVWGNALADALLVSAYTGVRQGELLKLRGSDIDVALSQLWVGGKPTLITKGRNCRNIALHPRIQDILMDRSDRLYLFNADWNNKDQLYGAFKKVRKAAGITEDHVWHTFRHSFGTWLGETTHPRQIMALMGHANIETSLRYVKATDSATRSAVLAI